MSRVYMAESTFSTTGSIADVRLASRPSRLGALLAAVGATDPVSLVFAPVQTFPLNYQSPMARLSVRLNPKLQWNAGWQFYNYHEDFGLLSFYQGYHANMGYTSLTWAF